MSLKVAVTGASGFIGRHVIKIMLEHNVELVALTRNAQNLADLKVPLNIIEVDLATPPDKAYEYIGRPDVLLHLAWEGLPNYRSLHHFETELPRQYEFLKKLIVAGLPSMVVTGTCFEYGMQSGPLSADLLAIPTNPYGHAKNALRQQLEYIRQIHPFSFTWARLFYMYGEGQPAGSLYSQIKTAVEKKDEVFNLSGGEQLRDYLSVNAVARRLVDLTLCNQSTNVVNVCSGKPISIRSLVDRWVQEEGWNIRLNFGFFPYPDYEPMAFWGV